ncbi:MAG: hypothetical protein WDW38_008662 [Sanguina aurantia]
MRFYPEWYSFYTSQHSKRGTRLLHCIGTSLFLLWTAALTSHAYITGRQSIALFAVGPVMAYGCAWVSHFFIENNRPATFRAPVYSLMGDFLMTGRILCGIEKLDPMKDK